MENNTAGKVYERHKPLDNNEIRSVSTCFAEVMGSLRHTSAWGLSPHLGLAGGLNFRWQYSVCLPPIRDKSVNVRFPMKAVFIFLTSFLNSILPFCSAINI